MSATADKARYFLEQSVPELKEFERKKLFTSDEITAIAKKRSDFEHKINARGSTPSDYAHYAEFEINVDNLRKKRVKRLGVKATTHNGQRRIFFVFDRGTRKFPGDIGLWMQSIEYTRLQKSHKRLTQIFTNVLRLHPTKPQLWVYAARFAVDEHADITEARSYIQRGLRFCKNSRKIWVAYIQLEMSYIAKIYARRQILGIGKGTDTREDATHADESDDVMLLPRLTVEDVAPTAEENDKVDSVALQNLDSTPIMTGAIPITIFEAAFNQFDKDPSVGHELYEAIEEFEEIPITLKILQHIDRLLMAEVEDSWHTQSCHIAISIAGLKPDQPEFPAALRIMLQRMSAGLSKCEGDLRLRHWCQQLVDRLLNLELDPSLDAILRSKRKSLE